MKTPQEKLNDLLSEIKMDVGSNPLLKDVVYSMTNEDAAYFTGYICVLHTSLKDVLMEIGLYGEQEEQTELTTQVTETVPELSWVPVNSSSINKVMYNVSECTLLVKFHKAGVYVYYGVSMETYDRFIAAESKGKFFASVIKPGHRCQQAVDVGSN